MALASIAIAGAVAFLMLGPLTRLVIKFIERFNYRSAFWLALAICLAMVIGITGWTGLAVLLVATGIGLIPDYKSRISVYPYLPLLGYRGSGRVGVSLGFSKL